MRLDKFLKVSRLIKRRSVANEICSSGRVALNGRPAKPGAEVKPGDILEITFGQGRSRIQIREVRETVRKEQAQELYVILDSGQPGELN
ncbi:MAG: RNA-binding S4 domain-containing protein [Clostridia bacterium]|nr:RNA-binding S4 domain-containing protein [Eubacteriales bacterium]MDD4461623.1 RNA-binding S4 domain-containing protein [Eubacteriales bacterium]NCC47600.1 RNA-binding S4 domain-containing protein [Clostridia bacterium]